ncbi:hypothetical protein OHB12_21185 [Nocardia sp. NBC_01730]|uniref:hypothetical protein n=1 Tax=Nocardia sp. NBC_01730 TaxID=2975998 RepID=UPI002E11EE77|nr:hypothetical protein OHB12_21185 [Nocardia sp. NBC_01730]
MPGRARRTDVGIDLGRRFGSDVPVCSRLRVIHLIRAILFSAAGRRIHRVESGLVGRDHAEVPLTIPPTANTDYPMESTQR